METLMVMVVSVLAVTVTMLMVTMMMMMMATAMNVGILGKVLSLWWISCHQGQVRSSNLIWELVMVPILLVMVPILLVMVPILLRAKGGDALVGGVLVKEEGKMAERRACGGPGGSTGPGGLSLPLWEMATTTTTTTKMMIMVVMVVVVVMMMMSGGGSAVAAQNQVEFEGLSRAGWLSKRLWFPMSGSLVRRRGEVTRDLLLQGADTRKEGMMGEWKQL